MPSSFTFGKGVNAGRLRNEIITDPTLTSLFETIFATSGAPPALVAVTLDFSANLSVAQEATLSGIVSGHIPIPLKEVLTHVNTVNGISGAITLTVNEDATVIQNQTNDVSGTIDITTGIPSASGARINESLAIASSASSGVELSFTPASGTEFVMQHDLCTEKFIWNMWTTEIVPNCIVRPENVVASGKNHVAVTLDTPMSGFLSLISIGGVV